MYTINYIVLSFHFSGFLVVNRTAQLLFLVVLSPNIDMADLEKCRQWRMVQSQTKENNK